MENKKKKVGLALGGGGARGFCHLGVLEIFEENKIPIDIITGCSMGAVVGGGYAAGLTTEEMRKTAVGITQLLFSDFDIFNHTGLIKGERVMKIYKDLIGDINIEDCKIKFLAIATDLLQNKLIAYTEGSLWKAVRASMSIPGAFVPVTEDGMVLVDGGVLQRIPINQARELGADVVIAVDALGVPYEQPQLKTLIDVLEQSYLTMDWKCAKNEGKEADLLITPNLGSKSMLQFKDNMEAVYIGREAAIYALPKIKEILKAEGII